MKKYTLILTLFCFLFCFIAKAETYKATANGFGGLVEVELLIENGKLLDVSAKGDGETKGVGSIAIEKMPQMMLAENSIDVDIVSGATLTSNAILEAANAALNEHNIVLNTNNGNSEPSHIVPILDGFTLHSGVKFGMTMDEVIEIEKNAGFDAKKENLDDMYAFYCSNKHSKTCVSVSGQIAGVNGASIVYHFSKYGNLEAAVYGLAHDDKAGRYDPIRSSLIKKYGNPDSVMSEVWHHTLSMDVYSLADFFLENLNVPSIGFVCTIDYVHNDSWLIPVNEDTYVIITGIEFSQRVTGYAPVYITLVGYQKYDKTEIDKIQSSMNDL